MSIWFWLKQYFFVLLIWHPLHEVSPYLCATIIIGADARVGRHVSSSSWLHLYCHDSLPPLSNSFLPCWSLLHTGAHYTSARPHNSVSHYRRHALYFCFSCQFPRKKDNRHTIQGRNWNNANWGHHRNQIWFQSLLPLPPTEMLLLFWHLLDFK